MRLQTNLKKVWGMLVSLIAGIQAKMAVCELLADCSMAIAPNKLKR
jgi:hypothetical protein